MHFKLPQNLKFKKYNKKFLYKKGIEFKTSMLFFGSSCGLVAKESGCLTIPQLKTCFYIINKYIKTKRRDKKKLRCSIIIRAPLTEKALGARMGRGKGSVSRWVCFVRKGRMLFQFQNVKRIQAALLALKKISYKLPILTKVILRQPLVCRKRSFDFY